MTRLRVRAILCLGAAMVVLSREAVTQAPNPWPAWTLSGGAVTFRVSEGNGWAFGPTVGAQRRLRGRLRLDLNAAALLSSSGFYDFSGLSLDVGLAYAMTGGRLETSLGGGASAVVGGDSDGTSGGWVGGYLAGQGTAWLGPRFGISVRSALRLVSTGRTSPSFGGGVAVRF